MMSASLNFASARRPVRALLAATILGSAALAGTAPALAQAVYPQGTLQQREAMKVLDWMDGEWVGEATILAGPGAPMTHPHTERIGPMLGGSIKVIEGRTANDEGGAAFNAFAVISWSEEGGYVMRSYANGQAGDFPLTATPDGFSWTTPSRGGELRYVTTFRDGEWVEIGTFVMPDRPPMPVIELRLRRRGDTDWPAADPVLPE